MRLLLVLFACMPLCACAAPGSVIVSPTSAIIDASTGKATGGSTTESILACDSKHLEYTPLPAVPAGGYTAYKVTNGEPSLELTAWPATPTNVNALLTNISTNITQSSLDGSASVGGIFGVSHSRKQYVIDFMKWRAEPLYSIDSTTKVMTPIGWARVGAGLRLVVDILKDDGSASGSLLALAVSAKAGRVEGSISTELIGMDATQVTQAMPFTVDLSEGNIQKVIEALAIVKSKLYDNSTTVMPNLIARIQCSPPKIAPKN